jgi:hypothetical protein
MVKAELNQDMIATVAGEIPVYNYDGETREYLSSSVEYLAVGVGIPANSCIDAPGEKRRLCYLPYSRPFIMGIYHRPQRSNRL